MTMESQPISLPSSLISGNYYDCRPYISADHAILLCACGSGIQCISTKTGELMGTFVGHSSPVTCLSADTHNKSTIHSSSLDGSIFSWNIVNFKVVNHFKLRTPVYDMIHSSSKPTEIFMVVGKHSSDSVGDSKESNGNDNKIRADSKKLVVFDMQTKTICRSLMSHLSNQCCISVTFFQQGANEFIILGNKRSITFFGVKSGIVYQAHTQNDLITCIASDKNGAIITGHTSGHITQWHDMQKWIKRQPLATAVPSKHATNAQAVKPPVCTSLHWHSHAVITVEISEDGRYAYSGGDESVLVMWQLASGVKSFLPRLGSAISYVVSNAADTRVGVTTADNCIRLVNVASMKIDWTLRALWIPPASTHRSKAIASDSSSRCSISTDPRTGYLTSDGFPGVLQMYDAVTRSYRTTHDITPYSNVSKTENATVLYMPSLTHRAFITYTLIFPGANSGAAGTDGKDSQVSEECNLLATVCVRKGEEATAEVCLKFWKHDDSSMSATSKYKLLAQVDRPHGSSKISALVFRPHDATSLMTSEGTPVARAVIGSCVTASMDGQLKVWMIRMIQQGKKMSTIHRHIQCSCAYTFTHREAPVGSLSFSIDGSILAASQDNVVTFWDPDTLSLKTSLVNACPKKVTFTGFVEPLSGSEQGGGCGKVWLVVGSSRSLSVVDLMTMQPMWSCRDNYTSFSVAASEKEAMVFASAGEVPGSQGWIACGVSRRSSNANHIAIFSPLSDVPLSTTDTHSKPISSCFWRNRNVANATTEDSSELPGQAVLKKGVVFITECGECAYIGEAGDKACQPIPTGVTSIVGSLVTIASLSERSKLPSLAMSNIKVSDVLVNAKDSTLGSLVNQTEPTSSIPSSSSDRSWVKDIIDANTQNIPPVSTVYDVMMSKLIRTTAAVKGDVANTKKNPVVEANPLSFLSSGKTNNGTKAVMKTNTVEVQDVCDIDRPTPASLTSSLSSVLLSYIANPDTAVVEKKRGAENVSDIANKRSKAADQRTPKKTPKR